MVAKAIEAAELLSTQGIQARVVNVSTIKPLDQAGVLRESEDMRHIFTVEEHNVIGGLGSAIAEVVAESGQAPLRRLGVQDAFGESGLADELLAKHGLQAEGICESVLGTLGIAR